MSCGDILLPDRVYPNSLGFKSQPSRHRPLDRGSWRIPPNALYPRLRTSSFSDYSSYSGRYATSRDSSSYSLFMSSSSSSSSTFSSRKSRQPVMGNNAKRYYQSMRVTSRTDHYHQVPSTHLRSQSERIRPCKSLTNISHSEETTPKAPIATEHGYSSRPHSVETITTRDDNSLKLYESSRWGSPVYQQPSPTYSNITNSVYSSDASICEERDWHSYQDRTEGSIRSRLKSVQSPVSTVNSDAHSDLLGNGMDRAKSRSASSLAVASLDMENINHDEFREKLRSILGLSKVCRSSIASEVDAHSRSPNGERFHKRLRRVLSVHSERSNSPSVRLKNKTKAHRQRTKSMPIDLENFLETHRREQTTACRSTSAAEPDSFQYSDEEWGHKDLAVGKELDQLEVFVDQDSLADYQVGGISEPRHGPVESATETAVNGLSQRNQLADLSLVADSGSEETAAAGAEVIEVTSCYTENNEGERNHLMYSKETERTNEQVVNVNNRVNSLFDNLPYQAIHNQYTQFTSDKQHYEQVVDISADFTADKTAGCDNVLLLTPPHILGKLANDDDETVTGWSSDTATSTTFTAAAYLEHSSDSDEFSRTTELSRELSYLSDDMESEVRPAAVRLSSYGFVINEKSSTASTNTDCQEGDQSHPNELSFTEKQQLDEEMVSPHDSLAQGIPGKSLCYFLQFDTPRSRPRKRHHSAKAQTTKEKLRRSKSAPRKTTVENLPSIKTSRLAAASPTATISSSVADSIAKFDDIQERRQELSSFEFTTPTITDNPDGTTEEKENDQNVVNQLQCEVQVAETTDITVQTQQTDKTWDKHELEQDMLHTSENTFFNTLSSGYSTGTDHDGAILNSPKQLDMDSVGCFGAQNRSEEMLLREEATSNNGGISPVFFSFSNPALSESTNSNSNAEDVPVTLTPAFGSHLDYTIDTFTLDTGNTIYPNLSVTRLSHNESQQEDNSLVSTTLVEETTPLVAVGELQNIDVSVTSVTSYGEEDQLIDDNQDLVEYTGSAQLPQSHRQQETELVYSSDEEQELDYITADDTDTIPSFDYLLHYKEVPILHSDSYTELQLTPRTLEAVIEESCGSSASSDTECEATKSDDDLTSTPPARDGDNWTSISVAAAEVPDGNVTCDSVNGTEDVSDTDTCSSEGKEIENIDHTSHTVELYVACKSNGQPKLSTGIVDQNMIDHTIQPGPAITDSIQQSDSIPLDMPVSVEPFEVSAHDSALEPTDPAELAAELSPVSSETDTMAPIGSSTVSELSDIGSGGTTSLCSNTLQLNNQTECGKPANNDNKLVLHFNNDLKSTNLVDKEAGHPIAFDLEGGNSHQLQHYTDPQTDPAEDDISMSSSLPESLSPSTSESSIAGYSTNTHLPLSESNGCKTPDYDGTTPNLREMENMVRRNLIYVSSQDLKSVNLLISSDVKTLPFPPDKSDIQSSSDRTDLPSPVEKTKLSGGEVPAPQNSPENQELLSPGEPLELPSTLEPSEIPLPIGSSEPPSSLEPLQVLPLPQEKPEIPETPELLSSLDKREAQYLESEPEIFDMEPDKPDEDCKSECSSSIFSSSDSQHSAVDTGFEDLASSDRCRDLMAKGSFTQYEAVTDFTSALDSDIETESTPAGNSQPLDRQNSFSSDRSTYSCDTDSSDIVESSEPLDNHYDTVRATDSSINRLYSVQVAEHQSVSDIATLPLRINHGVKVDKGGRDSDSILDDGGDNSGSVCSSNERSSSACSIRIQDNLVDLNDSPVTADAVRASLSSEEGDKSVRVDLTPHSSDNSPGMPHLSESRADNLDKNHNKPYSDVVSMDNITHEIVPSESEAIPNRSEVECDDKLFDRPESLTVTSSIMDESISTRNITSEHNLSQSEAELESEQAELPSEGLALSSRSSSSSTPVSVSERLIPMTKCREASESEHSDNGTDCHSTTSDYDNLHTEDILEEETGRLINEITCLMEEKICAECTVSSSVCVQQPLAGFSDEERMSAVCITTTESLADESGVVAVRNEPEIVGPVYSLTRSPVIPIDTADRYTARYVIIDTSGSSSEESQSDFCESEPIAAVKPRSDVTSDVLPGQRSGHIAESTDEQEIDILVKYGVIMTRSPEQKIGVHNSKLQDQCSTYKTPVSSSHSDKANQSNHLQLPNRNCRGSSSLYSTGEITGLSNPNCGAGSEAMSSDQQVKVTVEEEQYDVQILGGEEEPAEWKNLVERYKSVSSDSSASVELSDPGISPEDNWRLSERDETCLEEDMIQDSNALNPDLASDEESFRTNSLRYAGKTPHSKPSAPKSFPSNFSTVRPGGVAERFTEKMNTIEKRKSEKQRSKLAPISATIGKFSSAFRRFELNGKQERSNSVDGSLSSIRAQHSSVEGSTSYKSRPSRGTSKSEPRSPTNRTESKSEPRSPSNRTEKNKLTRQWPAGDENKPEQPVKEQKKSPSMKQAGRTVSLPLESSRLIKPLRESTNAPDVVPQAREEETDHLQHFESETKELKFDRKLATGNGANPHFDIDIVIKRNPLPDHIRPEDVKELPTAAITLGHNEVKLSKIPNRPISPPGEVITVWDTEVPVHDRKERVLSPTRLHVTKLNKEIPSRGLSPALSSQDSQGFVRLVSPLPQLGQRIRESNLVAPVPKKSGDHEKTEPVTSVSIRPQHSEQTAHRLRSKSQEDLLSPKMRTSFVLEPEQAPRKVTSSQKNPANDRPSISKADRAVPSRKSPPRTYADPINHSPMEGAFYKPPQQTENNRRVTEANITPMHHQEELRPGIVAEAKGAFSSQPHAVREDNYQARTSLPVRRERLASDDFDYTQRWVESSKHDQSLPSGRSSLRTADSPRRDSSTSSPPRSREGLRGHRHRPSPRSKSLGRKPCKAIAEMAQYFQEEANLSQVGLAGRPRSASPRDGQREKSFSPVLQQKSAPSYRSQPVDPGPRYNTNQIKHVAGKSQPTEGHSQANSSYFESQARRGTRSKQPRPRSYNSSEQEDYAADGPSSPKAASGGIRQFISLYNDMERSNKPVDAERIRGVDVMSEDRFEQQMVRNQKGRPSRGSVDQTYSKPSWRDEPITQRQPQKFFRDQQTNTETKYHSDSTRNHGGDLAVLDQYEPRARVVADQRMRRVDTATSHSLSPQSHAAAVDEDNNVDDRPLTASAWKAWLGNANDRSSLERKVENAFSQHIASGNDVHRAEPFRVASPGHRESDRKSKPEMAVQAEKVVPLWKQQNQMAAKGRSISGEGKSANEREVCRTPEPFQQVRVVNDIAMERQSSEEKTPPPPERMPVQYKEEVVDHKVPSPTHSRQDTFIEHQMVTPPLNGYHHSHGDTNYDYHPYANSSFHAEQAARPNPEDEYAQIQKKRPMPQHQEPYHSPPTQYSSYPAPPPSQDVYAQPDDTYHPYSIPHQEQDATHALLIQVPPPKPDRTQYLSQSEEQLHVSRQSMPESVRQLPQQATNQSYMDPYVNQESYPGQSSAWYPDQNYNQPAPSTQYSREPVYNRDPSYSSDPSYQRNYNPPPQQPYYHDIPPTAHNPNYTQQGDSYRQVPHYPSQYTVDPRSNPRPDPRVVPRADPRVDTRPDTRVDPRSYQTMDPRYLQQPKYDRRPDPRDALYHAATVDRRSYPTNPSRPAYNQGAGIPDLRYNPRTDRVEVVDPRYRQPQQTHAAEIHHDIRPQRHATESERHQDKRPQRSKSLPNSKPSHKQTDSSKPSKDKPSKHGSSGSKPSSKHKEKEKKNKNSGMNLPDFIPIQHVTPAYQPAPPNQYDYGQHQARLSQGPHINRGRPGVGVMFNPDIGVTDF